MQKKIKKKLRKSYVKKHSQKKSKQIEKKLANLSDELQFKKEKALERSGNETRNIKISSRVKRAGLRPIQNGEVMKVKMVGKIEDFHKDKLWISFPYLGIVLDISSLRNKGKDEKYANKLKRKIQKNYDSGVPKSDLKGSEITFTEVVLVHTKDIDDIDLEGNVVALEFSEDSIFFDQFPDEVAYKADIYSSIDPSLRFRDVTAGRGVDKD
jgi:hypothetical protein